MGESPIELPPPTSKGPLGGISDHSALTPNSPRQKELIHSFKKIIAAHLQEIEGKTTEDFLEDLSLELWKTVRKMV